MRKLLLTSLLLLSSCATLVSNYTYCGNVDVLAVHVKEGTELSCPEALRITNSAYELLWQQAAGPLNEQWRVDYIWGLIDVIGASAKIEPDQRRITVSVSESESVFHELLHAYMTETHSGGRNQHRTMCSNSKWQQLEKNFGVHAYCQYMYFRHGIK